MVNLLNTTYKERIEFQKTLKNNKRNDCNESLTSPDAQGLEDFIDVSVNWTINNRCQLDCSYCYAKNDMVHVKKDADYKICLSRLKLIKVPFNVCLLGGEPTLHKNFYDIIAGLCNIEMCYEISLTTNLFKNIKYWETFNKKEFSNKLVISASYHPEYDVNYVGKILYLNKLKYINIDCNINLVPDKKYSDKIINVIKEIEKNKII